MQRAIFKLTCLNVESSLQLDKAPTAEPIKQRKQNKTNKHIIKLQYCYCFLKKSFTLWFCNTLKLKYICVCRIKTEKKFIWEKVKLFFWTL